MNSSVGTSSTECTCTVYCIENETSATRNILIQLTIYSLSLSLSLSLRFNGYFPDEPGLAGFTEAKDD